MLIVCGPEQTRTISRPTKLLTVNVAMPGWLKFVADHVSALVRPEQPCVITTAGARPSPAGNLSRPKMVAGASSWSGGRKGGSKRLPTNVRL